MAQRRPSPRTSLLACGFATAVAQATLLREAMTALSGSELAWGLVLGLWLAAMALGSRIGVQRDPGAAAWAPTVVLLLTAAGVVLMRAAPALAGVATGETLAAWGALWIWLVAVLPAGVIGGLAFPLLAHELGRHDGAGKAYALEAAGALVGGVTFTFLLAPHGTVTTVCLAEALVLAALIGPRSRVAAAVVVVVAVIASQPLSAALASLTWRLSGRAGSLVASTQTPQQRLELAGPEPASVYADGHLMATFPDPYRVHPRAHLLMLLHPRPDRVLVVGGLANGDLVPMLAHPVRSLDVVEDDPELASILSRWLGGALSGALLDPRVVIHRRDAVDVVRRNGPWDLILLLDADPATVRRDRTRTAEFFSDCAHALNPDGLLVVRVGVSDTYLGGAAGRLLRLLAASLNRSLAAVHAVPGSEVLLIAPRIERPDLLDPGVLRSRWEERGLEDPTFVPEMIDVLLDPERAEDLRPLLTATEPVNTVNRPRAVLLAAGLAEARGQPPLLRAVRSLEARSPAPLLLALLALISAAVASGAFGRSLGPQTAAVVGLSSMAWWLLLVSAWQMTVGSVYSQIGALSATFMGGLAAGSWWGARLARPARALPWLLLAGAALSAALASGAPIAVPRLAVLPLLAAGGVITGAAFPGVARLAGGRRSRRGAGLGFAADEGGAAVGALVIGLIAIPWAGHAATAAGIGALDLSVAAALLLSRRAAFR